MMLIVFVYRRSFDGSAKNYEIVFGIILGSGCGGGLVINKRIIQGINGLTGRVEFKSSTYI